MTQYCTCDYFCYSKNRFSSLKTVPRIHWNSEWLILCDSYYYEWRSSFVNTWVRVQNQIFKYTWAAILPLPILRSVLTTTTSLQSPSSSELCSKWEKISPASILKKLGQKTYLFFGLWAEFFFVEVNRLASAQENPRETDTATETSEKPFVQQPLHGVCHEDCAISSLLSVPKTWNNST